VTLADFLRADGYEDDTSFLHFQRDDPKSTKASQQNFERVLAALGHLPAITNRPSRAVTIPAA
jgi:hypothetical protein